jgi:putative copper resistance protein D
MSLATWFVLCRFAHFIAVMQIFGVGIFTTILTPQSFAGEMQNRLRPVLIGSALLSMLTAVGMLAIQAGLMGNGWPDVINLRIWQAVLGTTFGTVWRWHLLFAVLTLFVTLFCHARLGRHLTLIGATLLLVSLALIGHAAMREGGWGDVQRINHVFHLLSAAYWFGCLLPLLVCLPYAHRENQHHDAIRSLIRFSTGGHLAVALVILTGIINTALIVQGWPFNLSSIYQRLLLIKIALVMIMVALAILNRYWVVPALRRPNSRSPRKLVLITCSELALSLGVLLLVSWFATLEPINA